MLTQQEDASVTVSVLVPITSRTLPSEPVRALFQELIGQLEAIGEPFEVLYLLGEASDDLTQLLRSLCSQDSERIRVIEFGRNLHHTALMAAGVERANGRLIVLSPPYYDVDMSILSELYHKVAEGADVAIAARRPNLGSRLFNRTVRVATGTRFSDIASGTRVIRREVLDEIPFYGDFDRFLPVLADRLGWAVREVRATPHPRFRQQIDPRSPGPLTRAADRLMDVLSLFFISRFTRRPLRLFGGLGAVFAVTGLLVLLVASIQRLFFHEPMADRPVLVLGTLLIGLGVQTLTIGLLGELIIFFQARKIRDYRVSAVYEATPPPLPVSPETAQAPPTTGSTGTRSELVSPEVS